MLTITDIGTLIVCSLGICGNRPRIAGTRITVQSMAVDHQTGMTPKEIVNERPYLTLAQVYAALAYYYANNSVINAEIAAEDAEYDRCSASQG